MLIFNILCIFIIIYSSSLLIGVGVFFDFIPGIIFGILNSIVGFYFFRETIVNIRKGIIERIRKGIRN